jgi:DNA-binding XRE family transcriptional regulator
MIDKQITDRCKAKLIAVARANGTITYSELANLLGVANQSIGRYLNAIYEEEIALGHPDLTVVVVYAKTGMGRFNSGGPGTKHPCRS